jgi:enoyl-CoA hydratase
MPDDSASPLVVTEPEPGITVLRLNRPERLNALSPELVAGISATLAALSTDQSVRAIVLTGTGRGFCAGLDLVGASQALQAASAPGSGPAADGGVPGRLRGQEQFSDMVKAIRRARQPVIAAVNGPAAGAGMALALACDVRVASESAAFHVASVKLGLSAGECGISWHLPRQVGTARGFEILLTGRPVRSAEAAEIGLVSRVVPDGEALDAALEAARAIAANSPFAVWQTKQLMWANLELGFDAAIELENRTQILAVHTKDHAAAVAAFNEKRSPTFTGE